MNLTLLISFKNQGPFTFEEAIDRKGEKDFLKNLILSILFRNQRPFTSEEVK